jgi:CHAD domain-containing protein
MKTKALPQAVTDEGTCVFGSGVLLKHLQALDDEIEGVRSGKADIEFIHRARVATRRLRAAMPLFPSCLPKKKGKAWLKIIRGVTRALGEARDADVQMEALEEFAGQQTDLHFKTGLQRLILRLHQKRMALQPPVTQAMEELLESDLLVKMRAVLQPQADRSVSVYIYTPALYQHSFQSITGRLDALLAFEPIVTQPEKVTELHQMRIAAKWLRYTLENFGPLYSSELKPYIQAVKKAQDELGEIHDCDVWAEFLPRFLAEERQRILDYYGNTRTYNRYVPGIMAFEQDRRQARADMYVQFQESWAGWGAAGLWDELHRSIQIPFPQDAQVYPPPPVPAEEKAPDPQLPGENAPDPQEAEQQGS